MPGVRSRAVFGDLWESGLCVFSFFLESLDLLDCYQTMPRHIYFVYMSGHSLVTYHTQGKSAINLASIQTVPFHSRLIFGISGGPTFVVLSRGGCRNLGLRGCRGIQVEVVISVEARIG